MTLLLAALNLQAHDTLLPHHEADFKQMGDQRTLAAGLAGLFALALIAAAVFIYRSADDADEEGGEDEH